MEVCADCCSINFNTVLFYFYLGLTRLGQQLDTNFGFLQISGNKQQKLTESTQSRDIFAADVQDDGPSKWTALATYRPS